MYYLFPRKTSSSKHRVPRKYYKIVLSLGPSFLETFGIVHEDDDELIILNEEQVEQLITHLKSEIDLFELRLKFVKELETTRLREQQLKETRAIVLNLRESDETSSAALGFLKEKLDLLSKEREVLGLLFSNLRIAIEAAPSEGALSRIVRRFLDQIVLLETDGWEKELDYYRTRFLLQREVEDEELRSDTFMSDETIPVRSTNAFSPVSSEISFVSSQICSLETESFLLIIPNKHRKIIDKLAKRYTQLQKEFSTVQKSEIFSQKPEELKKSISLQEEKSFEIGSEVFKLKREQGILTLKVYEIIQTVRSRMLNISGSLAARKFLRNALEDLAKYSQSEKADSFEEKNEILKIVLRLLRILGKEPPADYNTS